MIIEVPTKCPECDHPLVARRVEAKAAYVDRKVENNVLTDTVDVTVTVLMEPHFHGKTIVSITPGMMFQAKRDG